MIPDDAGRLSRGIARMPEADREPTQARLEHVLISLDNGALSSVALRAELAKTIRAKEKLELTIRRANNH